jgi:hypothetical protein
VLVNARTGEVQGEWPKSWVKIARLVILALIVAGAIWFLVQSQGGGGTYVEWSPLESHIASQLCASHSNSAPGLLGRDLYPYVAVG